MSRKPPEPDPADEPDEPEGAGVDEDVRRVLRELARSINDGLERSGGVGAAVKRLEAMGFNVTLYLEATLLLNRRGETRTSPVRIGSRPARAPSGGAGSGRLRSGSLTLSEKDLRFLKSLKIALNSGEKKTGRRRPAPGRKEGS